MGEREIIGRISNCASPTKSVFHKQRKLQKMEQVREKTEENRLREIKESDYFTKCYI